MARRLLDLRANLPVLIVRILLATTVAMALTISPQEIAASSSPVKRQSNVDGTPYKKQNLCRRFEHQSAILDDTLYLFGGKMHVRKQSRAGGVAVQDNNDFIKLSLKETFYVKDAKWTIVDETDDSNTPPAFSGGALFSNPETSTLHLFEGRTPENLPEQSSSIYSFGLEKKEWKISQEWDHQDGKFPNRQSWGAGVEVPDKKLGFYVGGIRAYRNSTFAGWSYPTEEQLIRIDLTTGKVLDWSPLPMNQKRVGLDLVYLPGVGPEGSLLMLGGTGEYKVRRRGPPDRGQPGLRADDARINAMAQMDTVWLYDLKDSKWYWQRATGSLPWERKHHCMTAVSTGEGSHEIFLFGGGSDYNISMFGMNDSIYDDAYVLSLPSFTYMKLEEIGGEKRPLGRQRMKCFTVGSGKRQMMILGGSVVKATLPDGTEPEPERTCEKDEIHILELTNLEFLKEYSPQQAALPYKLSPLLEGTIKKEGKYIRGPAFGWDSTALEELFHGPQSSINGLGPISPPSGDCPSASSEESNPQTMATTQEKAKLATILAGVFGALSFICFLIIGYCAKKRKDETRRLESELEQLQLYYTYQTAGTEYYLTQSTVNSSYSSHMAQPGNRTSTTSLMPRATGRSDNGGYPGSDGLILASPGYVPPPRGGDNAVGPGSEAGGATIVTELERPLTFGERMMWLFGLQRESRERRVYEAHGYWGNRGAKEKVPPVIGQPTMIVEKIP